MQGLQPGAAGGVPVFSQPVFVHHLLPNGDVMENVQLRKVQIDNFLALQQGFPQHQTVLADMCTGSGKTGFACMAPFALAAAAAANPVALPHGCRRVLWICPTKAGRKVAVDGLLGEGGQAPGAFLKFYGVLHGVNGQLPTLPRVLELRDGLGFQTGEALAAAIRGADVVVATPQYFSAQHNWVPERTALGVLRQITLRDGPLFDLHIYDECHYLPTQSWNNIWQALRGPGAQTRYLAMSGTPYRTDNTNINREADLDRFMLIDALTITPPMVKDICLLKLRPTVDEVAWARLREHLVQGDELRCTVSHPDLVLVRLLESTADLLRLLRSERGRGGIVPHRALGFVENRAQALRILQLAEHRRDRLIVLDIGQPVPKTMNVCYLDGQQGTVFNAATGTTAVLGDYDSIMQRFNNRDLFNPNSIDLIIQNKVLSESFNAPLVSVATMFRSKGTLVQFAQAVGRVARRISVDVLGIGSMQADMHDNTAHILLHEFSELRSRFDEFCYRQGRREVQVQEDAEADAEANDYMLGFPMNAGNVVPPAAFDAADAAAQLPNAVPLVGISARRVVLAPHQDYHNNLMARLDAFHSHLPYQPLIQDGIAANFNPAYELP